MLGDIHQDGRRIESDTWCEWLVDIGYPFDMTFEDFPPCTLRQLAEAWQRRYSDEDASTEDWMWSIERETREWPADRRG